MMKNFKKATIFVALLMSISVNLSAPSVEYSLSDLKADRIQNQSQVTIVVKDLNGHNIGQFQLEILKCNMETFSKNLQKAADEILRCALIPQETIMSIVTKKASVHETFITLNMMREKNTLNVKEIEKKLQMIVQKLNGQTKTDADARMSKANCEGFMKPHTKESFEYQMKHPLHNQMMNGLT